jgi:hypothetical protein
VSHRIDRFIQAMFKKDAEQLLFGTDTPVRIRRHGVEKVILDKEVRTEQILRSSACWWTRRAPTSTSRPSSRR